ncbi:MAG: hypothetical protein KW793_03180 [Candidatus Doudnabacteria bacterium]|nr:hypothetical protein [Candidatus Doudnabacteria bacterium]
MEKKKKISTDDRHWLFLFGGKTPEEIISEVNRRIAPKHKAILHAQFPSQYEKEYKDEHPTDYIFFS